MKSTDGINIEKVIDTLDRTGWLFPQFRLLKRQDRIQVLGKGAFSVVYEMFSKERQEEHYALKVIGLGKHTVPSGVFRDTSEYQAVLSRESEHIVNVVGTRELLVSLDHESNVADVRDAGTGQGDGDGVCIQLILTEKLEDIITKDQSHGVTLLRKTLADEDEVINFALQIGQALEISHRHGILHRDVKLENIFWDGRRKIYKLGDFGISKLTEGGSAETIVYTDGYGAPEIKRRLSDSYNLTADIYSFGITLYLLLNDLRFPGSDGYYANAEVQYDPDCTFPAARNSSRELMGVIRRMCGYQPEERYQSMSEVLRELQRASEKKRAAITSGDTETIDVPTETYREREQEGPEWYLEGWRPLDEVYIPPVREQKKEPGYGADTSTYRILEKLGEGSGGIVYKAYHTRLKTEVVLKEIKGHNTSLSDKRQEVDILKHLRYAYLPQVLDFLTLPDGVYTVMSYIPGKNLRQLLDEKTRFSLGQLIRWGMQICSALDYLHRQKPPIIHGDIKPSNIMLTPQGNICLIDFNISFFLDESVVLGYTDGYTSPEQYIYALDRQSAHSIASYRAVDEKSDIYSVGATFYHLATGCRLHTNGKPPDIEKLSECTSDAFAKIIEKALERDPEKRFGSAYEMFRAFQGVSKKDFRYQSLLRRQSLARVALSVGIAGFIALGGYGVHTIMAERLARYNELVAKQEEYIGSGDYEKEEEAFQDASKLRPSALESYYQNARSLFEQGEYEKCISFIEYDVEQNEKLDLLQERMADVYYLKASGYFEIGAYAESVRAFAQVFEVGGYHSEYYRDYAVALAYDGKEGKARAVLKDAIGYGLGDDSVYYAKGEIEKSVGNTDEALSNFRSCIDTTKREDLKSRAYVMMSDIYRDDLELEQQREILLEAVQSLPVSNQMLLLPRLIQADIDLADEWDDDACREEAISYTGVVIGQGWATYNTYDTLAVLYEKTGELQSASDTLAEMISLFGEDYNIYKRYAFLEIDAQELRANADRDYSAFAGYYERAEELYRKQSDESDQEMQLLENVYQQVISGGWLS